MAKEPQLNQEDNAKYDLVVTTVKPTGKNMFSVQMTPPPGDPMGPVKIIGLNGSGTPELAANMSGTLLIDAAIPSQQDLTVYGPSDTTVRKIPAGMKVSISGEPTFAELPLDAPTLPIASNNNLFVNVAGLSGGTLKVDQGALMEHPSVNKHGATITNKDGTPTHDTATLDFAGLANLSAEQIAGLKDSFAIKGGAGENTAIFKNAFNIKLNPIKEDKGEHRNKLEVVIHGVRVGTINGYENVKIEAVELTIPTNNDVDASSGITINKKGLPSEIDRKPPSGPLGK